jgi:glycerophosphoryl diester phosphodiesterase
VLQLRPRPRPGHPYLAGAPLLVAHRGGAGLAPENTMAAFADAVDRWGADMLEMDVHATSDGRIVVIHDATVDRTTDGTGAVVSLPWKALEEMDAGFRFRDQEGRAAFARGGVRIPLFEEVLERFPRTRINVEAKVASVTAGLLDVIRRHGATHRVLVAATDDRARAVRHGYEGPTSASRTQLVRAHLLFRLGLSRFHVPATDALQLPDRWEGRRIVTPELIRWAHRCNLPVHVWTIDEEADMERLLDWGVDGIQTDRPDRLAGVLHRRVGRPLPPGLREEEGRE